MKKVKAKTAFMNNTMENVSREGNKNLANKGDVILLPEPIAETLEMRGYVEFIEEDEDETFTEKKETSEVKKEEEDQEDSGADVDKGNKMNFFDEMIPQTFPHFGQLKKNDIHTFGDLSDYSEDFTEISGIGESYSKDIKDAYMEARKEAINKLQNK